MFSMQAYASFAYSWFSFHDIFLETVAKAVFKLFLKGFFH